MPVLINSNNKLGTATSSVRFKEDIKPMDNVSEALFALKPVAFRYKKEIDPAGISQLGLVAEEVDKVNPDLVVRDKEGKPYSVRDEASRWNALSSTRCEKVCDFAALYLRLRRGICDRLEDKPIHLIRRCVPEHLDAFQSVGSDGRKTRLLVAALRIICI